MRPWRWRVSAWILIAWSVVVLALLAGAVARPDHASACRASAGSRWEQAGCVAGAWLADLVIYGLIWLAVAGPALLWRRRRRVG
jgi:hypothetical protein